MRLGYTRAVLLAALFAGVALPLRVQAQPFAVSLLPGEKIKITERADLRRYSDGRFQGLASREVRGVLQAAAGDAGATRLSGSFYVLEETKREARLVGARIDTVVPASFRLLPDGRYQVLEERGYPRLRSFPVFPQRELFPGDRWEAYGERVVEPLRDGTLTRVPFLAAYEYVGPATRSGREFELIEAQYAMRYRRGEDPLGDSRISRISGSHRVRIYYDAARMRPWLIETLVDETYQMTDGGTVGFKGFILTWFEGVITMNRTRVADLLRDELGPEVAVRPGGRSGGDPDSGGPDSGGPGASGGPGPGSPTWPDLLSGPGADTGTGGAGVAATGGVEVSESDLGVTLTISDIRFAPDSARVLPQERERLEAVARALASVEERSFLVVGHTALAGTEAGRQRLSEQRAQAIVDLLTEKGLEADRFLYEGRGAREPVADNSTPEGMARNRRVEIIILED